MAEVKTELQEIFVKLSPKEFKLVTAGLANLAEPGSVKLTQTSIREVKLEAAELNARLIETRATYLKNQLEAASGMAMRATELLERVKNSADRGIRETDM